MPALHGPHRRTLSGLVTALTIAATALSLGSLGPAEAADGRRATDLAPLLGEQRASAIEGRYIVVLEDRATARGLSRTRQLATGNGGTVLFDYRSALSGFAARLPDRAVQALRNNPNVAYVEADQTVRLDTTQSPATWGLDRIDQRNLPLNNTYTYNATGTGVTAFVIDTGIRATHAEFGGRVGTGYTAVSDGNGTSDCNGHGTHVAGTVGGTTYGVAKAVLLRPVRVLGCNGSGSNSGVIAGVDWVTANRTGPSVANMSLGGGVSSALDTAVNNSINAGVSYAVAAGNDYAANACNGSPSRVAAALTVGSTTKTDARSDFSNIGSCLDLFAPGSSITSAWITSDSSTNTISGTSMATPHVAGAAALYLQNNPSATPASVSSAIVGGATSGVVTGAGSGSPNRLLYSLVAGTTPTPNPSGNLVANPGFESGNTVWSASSGVVTSSVDVPAHAGSWKAWLNGYGQTHTDTLSQPVAIPSASSASLSFWMLVDSAETTTSTAYDKLAVQVVSGGTTSTLATYSNLNESTSYLKRTFDVSSYAGTSITLRLVGTEDSSLGTSFVLDDFALTAG